MGEKEKLDVNRSMRRRAKFFGVDKGVGVILAGIITIGVFLSSLVSTNLAIAVTFSLFLAALLLFKDGTAKFGARLRRPPHYTRSLERYQPFYLNQQKSRPIIR